jgi:8-oxo-dGTP pyrophosphatase MutT (NUDIX family)
MVEKTLVSEERFYDGEPDAPRPNVPLSPGVAAVIFDGQRRVLILKRSRGIYWSLPGGRLDLGESAPDCCIRETLEETGLRIRIVRLIACNTDPRRVVHYPDGNVHQSFVLCFEAEILSGDLVASFESEAFHWIGEEDLDAYALIPDSRQNILDAWQNQSAAFLR